MFFELVGKMCTYFYVGTYNECCTQLLNWKFCLYYKIADTARSNMPVNYRRLELEWFHSFNDDNIIER